MNQTHISSSFCIVRLFAPVLSVEQKNRITARCKEIAKRNKTSPYREKALALLNGNVVATAIPFHLGLSRVRRHFDVGSLEIRTLCEPSQAPSANGS